MSVGRDLVTLARDARAVYREAQRLRKDRRGEAAVSAAELAMLRALHAKLRALVRALPPSMTRTERRAMVTATKKLLEARIRDQRPVQDFEELARLHAQAFTLSQQLLKLEILETFDARALADPESLARILFEVDDAQRQIRTRMKTRGYVRIATKLAVLTIDLGVLVARAAG